MSALTLTADFPHSVNKVWHAIASREAMNLWLMPNDFEPIVGRKFTFRTDPAPGFDGIVHCEVLEVDPQRKLAYSWKGGPLDTLVTYILEPTADGGTRLHFTHEGFEGLKQRLIGGMLGRGWKRMVRRKLPEVLDRLDDAGNLGAAASPAGEPSISCHKSPLTRLRVALISMVPGKRGA